MKIEFVLIWLAALEKSNETLTSMDPHSWKLFQVLPVKTAAKKDGDILFYYVDRLQLIRAIKDTYNLREKCTLNC